MTADQHIKRQLANLTCGLFGFVAGVAAGSLATALLPHLKGSKKDQPQVVDARQRILAGLKQQHEQDIRREIFQTTESLRGELQKSLHRLVNLTERVLEQVHEESDSKKDQHPAVSEQTEPDATNR